MTDERRKGKWKPPAYQHYAKEWLVDTAHLTLEEQGAYQRLLDHQWVNGALPGEERDRAKLLSVTLITFRRIWRRIGGFFPAGLNSRLEEVRREQQDYRDQRARAGRRSAVVRASLGTAGQREGEREGNDDSTEPPTKGQRGGQRDPQRNATLQSAPASAPALPNDTTKSAAHAAVRTQLV